VAVIALDSNVFLYALLDQPPWSKQAQALLRSIESGAHTAFFSAITYGEVLGERPTESLLVAHDFLDGMGNTVCVEVSRSIGKRAGSLRTAFPVLRLTDALHLATAIEYGADMFITNDRPLAKVAKKLIPTEVLADRN